MYDRKGVVSAFRPKESALEAAKTFRLSVSFRPKDTFQPKVIISAERGLFRPKLGAKSAHTLAVIGRNEPLFSFGRNSLSAFGRKSFGRKSFGRTVEPSFLNQKFLLAGAGLGIVSFRLNLIHPRSLGRL